MNNLSIFIDIDQEFDRVLETIAIAGMVGKVNKLNKTQQKWKHLKKMQEQSLKDVTASFKDYNLEVEALEIMTKDYMRLWDNLSIRDSKGRFTSTRHVIKTDKIGEYVTPQNYKQLNHIKNNLTLEAGAMLDVNFNVFVALNISLREYKFKRNEMFNKYGDETYTLKTINKAIYGLEKDIKKTEVKLKKLGFVAIMKILKDIEKKAKRA